MWYCQYEESRAADIVTCRLLYGYLESRKAATNSSTNSQYVFAGDGKAGYLIEPCCQVQKGIKISDVPFTLHNLHRAFLTVAESIDISVYALKRLVNHRTSNDVTVGYYCQ